MTLKDIITKITAARKPRYAMTKPAYEEFKKLMDYKNKWKARALAAEKELAELREMASTAPKIERELTLH